MSLLGLHREKPLTSSAYISPALPADPSHASVRLGSDMEERDRPSTSRKRHRSDEISGSSFRLAQSSGISNNSRMRSVGNTQPLDNDSTIPTSEAPAPALEPLHPPIPSIQNFSAISQGTTRPASMPAAPPETPGGMIYNIALPLPNPGRAHRFCQACDHINHVRRKLCTNCGAPKPSAVRNAVGVRSISEVDSSADRRSQGDGMFKPDNYLQSHLPSAQFPQGGQFEVQNRLNSQGFTQGDPRFPRQTEYISYQARSLAMRSPGDDIPLLGSAQRPPQSSFPGPESQTSRRMRGGQAVLCEPLINFNTFGTPDNKASATTARQPYGNPVDFHQKVFPNPPLSDRDHFTLPSMQGIPAQKPSHHNINPRTSSRSPVADNRGSRNASQLPDDALPEDVLSLNRPGVGQTSRRFQNVHGLRQYPGDQPQTQFYAGVPDTSGLLYRQGQELFQPQAQFRPEDRGQILNHDPSRGQKFAQSLAISPPGEDRGFPSHQLDVQRGQGVSVLVDPQAHSSLRRGLEDDRTRQLSLEGRVEPQHLRQLQKSEEHVNVNTTHFDDSNRHPDDGRLTLDNTLIQHKGTGHTD